MEFTLVFVPINTLYGKEKSIPQIEVQWQALVNMEINLHDP
jgi:hypothetical protein